jgi:ABC-2 type transport system permease protein
MKNLLYKEFRLAIHPAMFVFMFFGILLLIPSWPFFIAFGYIFIAFMNIFIADRANQDIFFTACLPVRKSDTVKARIYTVAVFELMQVVIAIPFAILNTYISPHGNQAGMNPNIAFFGCVLMMYALFNIVFLPGFYKTAYKIGFPMLWGTAAAVLFGSAVEFIIHAFPAVMTCGVNDFRTGHLGIQLTVLGLGILLYFFLTWLAYKRSAKSFDMVDL